ncbi:winged helix-turn-helix domain-containing protein [Natrinema versiforme]|uniref:Winged helix-turn-helix transcriptional regulator n=1 Tax=Natrinema versiforme TaxID=88724 RepID=A0A4P8WL52_9EURY|nr:winged helix-turn-helix domain-containing protein [Natrinema versiforme]QCS42641.1 winged helix-turn-helix transcriptional regulator [Natrinema versiforme]
MRQPGDWMQLPTDERILEILESGLLLSPQVVAKNIGKSRSHVSRRLSVLLEYGLVTRVERGYYEITDLGEQYLAGEVDAETLEPTED